MQAYIQLLAQQSLAQLEQEREGTHLIHRRNRKRRRLPSRTLINPYTRRNRPDEHVHERIVHHLPRQPLQHGTRLSRVRGARAVRRRSSDRARGGRLHVDAEGVHVFARGQQHGACGAGDAARGRDGGGLAWGGEGVRVGGVLLVVEGHEAVVGCVDYAVEAGVEGEDDEDDKPAGDEVDEESDFVGAEPAPWIAR